MKKVYIIEEERQTLLKKGDLWPLQHKLVDPSWKESFHNDTPKTKDNYPNSQQVKAGLGPIGDLPPWTDKESTPTEEQLAAAREVLEDPMACSNGHRQTLLFCRRLMNLLQAREAKIAFLEEREKMLRNNR